MTSAVRGRGTQSVLAPEIELSVGTVHVASLAFQALFVTNEKMTLVSLFLHQPLLLFAVEGRVRSCRFAAFATDVCLDKSQPLGRTNPDELRSCQVADASRPTQSSKACGEMQFCFASKLVDQRPPCVI